MSSTTSTDETRDSTWRNDRNLDRRYGKIGISAVAAAVRYQGETRRPNDARNPSDDFD